MNEEKEWFIKAINRDLEQLDIYFLKAVRAYTRVLARDDSKGGAK